MSETNADAGHTQRSKGILAVLRQPAESGVQEQHQLHRRPLILQLVRIERDVHPETDCSADPAGDGAGVPEIPHADAGETEADDAAQLAAGPEHTSLQQMDEPYRRALTTIYSRLAATRKALLGRAPVRSARWDAEPYARPEAFAADLTVIVDSLRENGDGDLADGRLLNLREAVGAFGFHLAVMDLRQNTDVHERDLDELFRDSGVVSSYAGLKENRRVSLLLKELKFSANAPASRYLIRYSAALTKAGLSHLALCWMTTSLYRAGPFSRSKIAMYGMGTNPSPEPMLRMRPPA